MADPFTVLRGLFSAGMGTEGAEPYQGGATRAAKPVQMPYPADWPTTPYQGQFTPKSPDISAMSEADFTKLMETLNPDYPVRGLTPFNIDEAVARHQASVQPPPEVLRAYHGTTEGPVVKQVSPDATIFPKFRLPEQRSEKGVFFTPDPETASRYAGYSPTDQPYHGSKVFPVDLDMSNSVTVDLKKLGVPAESRWYDPRIVQTAIETAKQNNRDFVVIKGMKDIGGEADQIIAVRPSGKVRSALTGETLFGMLAGLFGVGGPRRKNAQQGTQAPDPANTQ